MQLPDGLRSDFGSLLESGAERANILEALSEPEARRERLSIAFTGLALSQLPWFDRLARGDQASLLAEAHQLRAVRGSRRMFVELLRRWKKTSGVRR